MKYNYVVFGTEDQYYIYGYSELSKHLDTVYFDKPVCLSSLYRIKNFIRRIHLSYKINNIISLPNKEYWNSHLFNYSFTNNKPICFVFFTKSKFTESIPFGFVEYLKSKYENSKFVVFYQDLVKFKRKVPLEMFRKKMDLLLSFDYKDSEENGMIYHPLVYSDIADSVKIIEKKDIYFCGAAKNRLDNILEAYSFFREKGLKCDFHVIVNNPKDYVNDDGLFYHKSFPYDENLRHVKSCKILLEIMQKGGTGNTIRACEAIAFNKKMLTNNAYIKKADFFDRDNFCYYDSVKNIDMSFVNSREKPSSYQYINLLSPYRFMEFIDDHLQ